MDSKWIVYEHISPSKKVYVGITSRSCEARWGKDGSKYFNRKKKNGSFVYSCFASALLKYGWNNFEHKVVSFNLTETEAKRLEKQLISYYKSRGLSYNITDGGDGRLGVTFKHTDEARLNISLHHRRVQTEETKQKISETQLGVKFPLWRKELLSKSHNKYKKRVCQYSLDGQLIQIFDSLMDAERATGTSSGNISRVCHGIVKTANGFKWTYYETKN